MLENKRPRISVVMAVYNGDRYLRQSIDSIFGQTYPNFELILIDDGSTDGTAQIINSYDDPRLVRITNADNIGQTRSLNKGLSIARGNFIARHDADDISLPDRFYQQLNYLVDHPKVGLLGTSYQLIDQRDRILEVVNLPTNNAELQMRLEKGNIFCHGSVMIRRDILDRVGGYREIFPVTQDYDLWLRLAEQCEICNLANPLYQFRFDGESISRKHRKLQLAYRQLSWEMAFQRRSIGVESVVPKDVLNVYPSEPKYLLEDARRSAYLFYASGQLEKATDMLYEADRLVSQMVDVSMNWDDWIWSRARKIAILKNDVNVGTKFIVWAFTNLPKKGGGGSINEVFGRFYADQAFWAYQNGMRMHVIRNVCQAVLYDRDWLRNRGLLVIFFRSLMKIA